jgi:hypothetical protein
MGATGENVYGDFDAWTDAFAAFVGAKGKVEPGKYRAYGYEAPGHLMKDLKAKWREIKTGLGYPPEGSSVEERARARNSARANGRDRAGVRR